MHTQNLFNILNSIKPLTEPLRSYLSEHTFPYKFVKGDQLIYQEPTSRIIYFIDYGLVCGIKIFNNKKTTLWFSNDGQFILPTLTASRNQFIERIEFQNPTLLVGMKYENAVKALGLFPEAKALFLKVIDKNIEEAQDRERFLRLSPLERHKVISIRIPFIFMLCDLKTMASYLNISLTQHQRIKRKL